jgi:hypothetical protein
VRNADDGATNDIAIGNIPGHDFEPLARIQRAVVAERANGDIAELIVIEDATDEIRSDLAGRASNENAFHGIRLRGWFEVIASGQILDWTEGICW